MKEQNKFYFKTLLAVSFFALAITGCKKEKTTDINSPSYKIEQSEKLIIPAEVDLPPNAPDGNTRVATYYAEGIQKYKAQVKAGSNPATYEWVFVAPQADLYDASGKKIGTHGAGPYWTSESVQTGIIDSIFAQQFSPAKQVSVDHASIPWLQLMPKTGKIPTGIFANVSYIQRIATTGGKAPATEPLSLSETANVFYTAIYRFSKRN